MKQTSKPPRKPLPSIWVSGIALVREGEVCGTVQPVRGSAWFTYLDGIHVVLCDRNRNRSDIQWVMFCETLGLDSVQLKSQDAYDASKEALDLVVQRLKQLTARATALTSAQFYSEDVDTSKDTNATRP